MFGQIIKLIPRHLLIKCVDIYHADKHCSAHKTYDQLVSLLFGQLNKCLSLREITMGLDLTPETITDIGLAQSPAKSTMSDGNAKRDYRVFELLYKELIKHYRTIYARTPDYKVIDEIKGKNIKIWNIETFFKLIKQNLQIKTFVGTHPNSCKSQLFVGLIAYFLLELIRRAISKIRHRFGHFATLIRICLMHYTGLDYVVNEIKGVVKKARESKSPPKTMQKALFA